MPAPRYLQWPRHLRCFSITKAILLSVVAIYNIFMAIRFIDDGPFQPCKDTITNRCGKDAAYWRGIVRDWKGVIAIVIFIRVLGFSCIGVLLSLLCAMNRRAALMSSIENLPLLNLLTLKDKEKFSYPTTVCIKIWNIIALCFQIFLVVIIGGHGKDILLVILIVTSIYELMMVFVECRCLAEMTKIYHEDIGYSRRRTYPPPVSPRNYLDRNAVAGIIQTEMQQP